MKALHDHVKEGLRVVQNYICDLEPHSLLPSDLSIVSAVIPLVIEILPIESVIRPQQESHEIIQALVLPNKPLFQNLC